MPMFAATLSQGLRLFSLLRSFFKANLLASEFLKLHCNFYFLILCLTLLIVLKCLHTVCLDPFMFLVDLLK